MASKKKNPLFVWRKDRKICPSGSPFVTTRQASWCQTAIIGTEFSILPSHSWWILAYSLLICCLHAAKSDFLATRSNKIEKIIITAELHFKTYNPLRIKVHLWCWRPWSTQLLHRLEIVKKNGERSIKLIYKYRIIMILIKLLGCISKRFFHDWVELTHRCRNRSSIVIFPPALFSIRQENYICAIFSQEHLAFIVYQISAYLSTLLFSNDNS